MQTDMGPRDSFASDPAPIGGSTPPQSAPPPSDPFRVQARDPLPAPTRTAGRKAFVGAGVGAFLGLLAVTLSAGEFFVVLACALLGAALAVIVQNAFPDGVDVQAAWNALRR